MVYWRERNWISNLIRYKNNKSRVKLTYLTFMRRAL